MNAEEMEAKLAALEKKVQEQEKKLTTLEDIEAIKRLQKAYNYYVEHMMGQEIIDCFSDSPDVRLNWIEGQWLGKEGVKKYFARATSGDNPPGFSHQLMPIGGLITVDPDGKTAKGRWNTWLAEAMNVGGIPRQQWVQGYYENEYVKENGQWKFKKLHWNVTFFTSFEAGWLKIPLLGLLNREDADMPAPHFHPYPSGYRLPYHFTHPIT